VTAVGAGLADGIGAIGHPLIAGVRGRGLWLAIALRGALAGPVEYACARAGFLVNAVAPDAIRLAPPLILTSDEAGLFTAALPAILAEVAKEAGAAAGAPFMQINDRAEGTGQ
jgi:acetylornithine aminotransferase